MTTGRYAAVRQSGKFPSAFTVPQGHAQPENHPETSCTSGFRIERQRSVFVRRKDITSSSSPYTCLLLSCLRLSALLFRPRCLSVTTQEHTKEKEGKKKQENPGLIKMPRSLCSLTILLFLSWVNSRCVRKRLLRAVATTSKTKRTLQEEYEILIKLVRLRISSPSYKGGSCTVLSTVVSLRASPPHSAEPAPIFSVNDAGLGILYLLPLRRNSENQ